MPENAFANKQVTPILLVKHGRYDEARALFAKTPHRKYHAFYLEGLIAKRQGDLDLAEKYFRAALAENPNFISAQKQLAHVLFLNDKLDGAKYHFEALAENSHSEVERQNFNQFISAIRTKRPYGISAYFGFLPSSNFNKGTDNPQTGALNAVGGNQAGTVNEDSQSQSGIGITAGVSGFYRRELQNNTLLLFSGSLGGNFYEKSQFNSASMVFNAELGKRLDTGNIFIGTTVNYTISDFTPDSNIGDFQRSSVRYGVNLRGLHIIDQKNLLSFNFGALRQRFDSFEARDGYFYSSFINWRHTLSNSEFVNLGVGVLGEDTERDDQTYIGYRVETAFEKNWKGGLSTTISAGYQRREYDGLFTGENIAREDNRYFVGVSALHPKLAYKGFAPKVSYKYSVQESNISFREFDSHDLNIIWTKKF